MTYQSTRRRARWRAGSLVAALGAALTMGCAEPPSTPTSTIASDHVVTFAKGASVGDQLGHLRAVTARFHDIEAAAAAGYTIQLTGCMSDPTLGGMGFHYGKGSAIDATADALEPEVLLYEPQRNGRYRLVGLEFIIPYDFRPRDEPAPTLFGQTFKQNDGFQLWALHVWIWRDNPAGMFEDWNPKVDCDAAPAASRASHSAH